MGYIKESYGIDFVVDPKPLTDEDRKMISGVIAYYRITGRKKLAAKNTTGKSSRKKPLKKLST